MARAPRAIYSLWADISDAIPSAILSGIVGDTAHSFGYHLARQDLPTDDYSVQLPADRQGASDCASALDISLSPALMKTCTARLLAAAKAGDPRLKGLREFCGTLNGTQTYPWDLSSNTSEGVNSWDNSHLWHIHLSFYRAYADDYPTLAPIAEVLAGIEGADMPLTDAEIQKIADRVWAKRFAMPGDPKTTYPASTWLVYGNLKAGAAQAAAAAAQAAAKVAIDTAGVAQDIKQRVIALLGGQS